MTKRKNDNDDQKKKGQDKQFFWPMPSNIGRQNQFVKNNKRM